MKSLHKLISRLSQTEKRYIKLQCGAHRTNSNLINYFNVISNLKEYDEAEILKKAKIPRENVGKARVSFKQLYDLILKQLRLYNDGNKNINRFNGWLMDIQYLYDQNLKKEALKLCKKLIKEAQTYEEFAVLIQAYNIERMILVNEEEYHLNPIKDHNQLINDAVKKLQNLSEITKLKTDIKRIYDDIHSMGNKTKRNNLLKKYFSHHLLASPKNMLSTKAEVSYYWCYSSLYSALIDFGNEYVASKMVYDLVFESPIYQDEYNIQMTALNNYLNSCITFYFIDDARRAYNQFIKTFEGNRAIKSKKRTYNSFLYYKSYFGLHLDRLDKDFKMTEDIALFFEQNEDEIFNGSKELSHIVIRLNVAHNYLISGEAKKASKWLNAVNNCKNLFSYESMFKVTRLTQLLVFYILEKPELVENGLTSLQRYLREERVMLNDHEEVVFDSIKRLLKCHGTADKKQLAEEAYNKMKHSTIFGAYFKSIAEGISFKEASLNIQQYVKKRYRKNLDDQFEKKEIRLAVA